ncbi:MAG: DUF882 domain-containing protein [Methyloligellaceae bacterium]
MTFSYSKTSFMLTCKGSITAFCLLIVCLSFMFGTAPTKSANPRNQTISIYNIHTKQKLRIVYKRDGRYIKSALNKINHVMRDWRTDNQIKMDPKLIDLMWELHTELGSKEPIHLISGYRSKKTNEKLRKTRGGQAKFSQHIVGKAADVHFPDVSIRQMRNSAMVRERGGVGYYPTSALPFVHLDTGRIRHWPRMNRYELAALFPDGRSRHVPSDGKSLTSRDYKIAMTRLSASKKFDARVALGQISRQQQRTKVAALSDANKGVIKPGNSLKFASLVPIPKPASRPQRDASKRIIAVPEPSRVDRSWFAFITRKDSGTKPDDGRLKLASANPAILRRGDPLSRRDRNTPLPRDDGWVRAPAYDDEHPEELSYRPFPVLPLMSEKSVSENRQLARLTQPDFKRTYLLIGEPVQRIQLNFRSGMQFAEMLWISQFTGEAVPNLLTGETGTDTRQSSRSQTAR